MNTSKKYYFKKPGNPHRRSIVAGSSIVILIAVLGLFGYIPGLRLLGSVRPDYIPMAPSTAISFLLLSIILIVYIHGYLRIRTRYIAITLSALISIFGLYKWIEYYAGVETSFEEKFVSISSKVGEMPVGIMSPTTGALFFLSGIIMILLVSQIAQKKHSIFIRHLPGILGSILFLCSIIFVLAYLYGQPIFYDMGKVVPMAITTAIAFLFLGTVLVGIAGIGNFPLLLFSGSSIRSKLLRIFIPLSFVIILIQDISTKSIYNNLEINNALLVSLWIVGFAIIIGIIIFNIGNAFGENIDKAQKQVYDISKFPSENPNSVMRINREGKVIYSNDVGKAHLSKLNSRVGSKAPEIFSNITARLLSKKRKNSEILNTKIGNNTYEYIIISIKDSDYVNLYGRDITSRIKAETELLKSFTRLKKTLADTITSLSLIVEVKDPYTSGHQKRVAKIAVSIAKELGLNSKIIDTIKTTATIHDIGKIYIPQSILSKPGNITEAEYSLIKSHPKFGCDIIKNIEFDSPIIGIILQHHERINGSGYPNGLKNNKILLEAKILGVADVIEAMSSHRPYRPSLGINAAIGEIKKNKGKLYDQKVVEACVKIFKEGKITLD